MKSYEPGIGSNWRRSLRRTLVQHNIQEHTMIEVRPAIEKDLQQILDIYNDAIVILQRPYFNMMAYN